LIGCRNTVAVAMRMGLKSRVCKRFADHDAIRPTAKPKPLDRDFAAEAPNRKWVTDITYLATATGWVYRVVSICSCKAMLVDARRGDVSAMPCDSH
jgi:putative transposase